MVYACVAFTLLVLVPSPKYQVLLPGPGSDVFVNMIQLLVQALAALLMNEAVRVPMFTYDGLISVSVQPAAFLVTSVTLYAPGAL